MGRGRGGGSEIGTFFSSCRTLQCNHATMTETERFSDLEKDMAELAAKMGPAMQTYWNYSRNRFLYQSTLVRRLLATASWKRPARLLDVGPSFQTRLFGRMLGPEAHIDTF